jgi:hypothetical protein
LTTTRTVFVASAATSSHRRPSCRVPRPSSSCVVVVVARPRHRDKQHDDGATRQYIRFLAIMRRRNQRSSSSS